MTGLQEYRIRVLVNPDVQPELVQALQLVQALAGEGAVTLITSAPVPDQPLGTLFDYLKQIPREQREQAEREFIGFVRAREAAHPSPFVTRKELRIFLQGLNPGNSARINKGSHHLWRLYSIGDTCEPLEVLEYVINCAACGVTVTSAECMGHPSPYVGHNTLSVSRRSIIEQHPVLMKRTGLIGIGPSYKKDATAFVRHLTEQMQRG